MYYLKTDILFLHVCYKFPISDPCLKEQCLTTCMSSLPLLSCMADLTEYASSMLGDEMFSKTLKSLDSLKVTDPWRVYIISNYR